MFSWNGNEGVDCTEGINPGQYTYDLDEMIFHLRSQRNDPKRKNKNDLTMIQNEIDPNGYK